MKKMYYVTQHRTVVEKLNMCVMAESQEQANRLAGADMSDIQKELDVDEYTHLDSEIHAILDNGKAWTMSPSEQAVYEELAKDEHNERYPNDGWSGQ